MLDYRPVNMLQYACMLETVSRVLEYSIPMLPLTEALAIVNITFQGP